MSKIFKAARFAAYAHEGQRYGDQPYFYHLAAVVSVMIEFGVVDEDLLSAGWLHDCIEDTEYTGKALGSIFGNEVSDLVWACTGEGKNRKERNACIANRITKSRPRAAIVKTADRIANMRSAKLTNQPLHEMYVSEVDDFIEAMDKALEQLEGRDQSVLNSMLLKLPY